MKLLIEQNENGGKAQECRQEKELEAAGEENIAELSAIFKRLYEDSVTGRISDQRFTELSADYEAEAMGAERKSRRYPSGAFTKHRKPP